MSAYESLYAAYGVAALLAAASLLLLEASRPPIVPLLVLSVLGAVAVHFNADADDGGKAAASADGMVIAASVLFFRESSPVLGPMLVGMAGAFWRVPRTRHEWFTIPGNLAIGAFSALAAASVLAILPVSPTPTAAGLAAAVIPIALAYAAVNAGLMVPCVALAGGTRVRDIATQFIPHLAGLYVPFLFGAFVGELSLRYGLWVFAPVTVAFVMIQSQFAAARRLVDARTETVDGLVAAIEAKDPYTAGHSKRVQKYALYVAGRLGIRGAARRRLGEHALLHDLGKIAVANHVLRKPGRFTPEEREIMLRHEPAGAAMLEQIPDLRASALAASGAADRVGLDGPVHPAHIVHAMDSYDAMTSTRAYRAAKTQEEAFAEMRRCAGKDKQFHPAVVEALISELEKRGEVHGQGYETEITNYAVAPPTDRGLGETLHDGEEVADVELASERATISKSVLLSLALVATAAVAGAFGAVPVALAALIGAAAPLRLQPLHAPSRPVSLLVMLVALAALPMPDAALTIAAGLAIGFRPNSVRAFVADVVMAAAACGTYVLLGRAFDLAHLGVSFAVLAATTVVALAAHELAGTHRIAMTTRERLADLALVAMAPFVALAIAGTTATAGFGLGALAVLVIPMALLANGYNQTQSAHANLFGLVRATSIAPEYAGLVVPGRAERVVELALELGEREGLDPEALELLEAAAWAESFGACVLDDPSDSGEPHRAEDIIEASAAVLKASKTFYPAGQILYASLNEPEMATNSPIDRAGQVLRVAVAWENATNGDVERRRVPTQVAQLRHSAWQPLDGELCDHLQAVVAPGTHRSTWEPVRTHAVLECECVDRVDDFAFVGDEHTCATHGATAVAALAIDQIRAVLDDHDQLVAAFDRLAAPSNGALAYQLARELFNRLDAEPMMPTSAKVASAGLQAGVIVEQQVARHLREAGASPQYVADVLAVAKVSTFDAYSAIRREFEAAEVMRWLERATQPA